MALNCDSGGCYILNIKSQPPILQIGTLTGGRVSEIHVGAEYFVFPYWIDDNMVDEIRPAVRGDVNVVNDTQIKVRVLVGKVGQAVVGFVGLCTKAVPGIQSGQISDFLLGGQTLFQCLP